jgi:Recombination endonuclease VII
VNPISRKQAIAEDRKHYWTGKPCKNGHISKRLVSTRQCTACMHKILFDRYCRNRAAEKARSRNYQRQKLPPPTRPCPQVCELCGRPPKTRALALDHDHETGEFRGWLCGVCNMALGKLGDSKESLSKALSYLCGEFIHANATNGCHGAQSDADV